MRHKPQSVFPCPCRLLRGCPFHWWQQGEWHPHLITTQLPKHHPITYPHLPYLPAPSRRLTPVIDVACAKMMLPTCPVLPVAPSLSRPSQALHVTRVESLSSIAQPWRGTLQIGADQGGSQGHSASQWSCRVHEQCPVGCNPSQHAEQAVVSSLAHATPSSARRDVLEA